MPSGQNGVGRGSYIIFLLSGVLRSRVTDFWLQFLYILVDTLGSKQQERPQGAPLVTFWKLAVGICRYCLRALPRIFGCEFGADLCRRVFWCGFWRGFSNWVFEFWCEFLVRFFAEGTKPQNRAFSKKSNQNSDPKFGHLSQPWGKVLEGGRAVGGTQGSLRLALGWERRGKQGYRTQLLMSSFFIASPAPSVLEFCRYCL